MIKSMTGYGKSVGYFQNKTISVEIKSLNSKSLNLYTKIPDCFSDKELFIRNEITNFLQNGKISATITLDSDIDKTVKLNISVIESYYNQLSEISKKFNRNFNDENVLQIIMRMPEVYKMQNEDNNPDEWNVVVETLKSAIIEIDNFRIQEGKSLENDIMSKLNKIMDLIPEVEKYESERITLIKDRLNSKLNENISKEEQNDNRFEQEIIYYLDKFDLNEEKSRLLNHCEYFIETVKLTESAGTKLGFITQEIGREINTLGSKANHAEIQKIAVQMKDELGKIREQILNIL
jgi:uncharacterized protein (TIGR00255 family)